MTSQSFQFTLVILFSLTMRIDQYLVCCANVDELGPYFEGDILSFAPSFLQNHSKNGLINKEALWKNHTIPYEFQQGYPFPLREIFHRATAHISERTCLKFIPRTSEPDYVTIYEGSSCSSHVGRMKKEQKMSLPWKCATALGIFIHELLHAVGLHHEQSRSDRDDWVFIQWGNIRKHAWHNFQSYSPDKISPYGVAYDYSSVLHYSRKAFSKNNEDTIVPKKVGANIGQRLGMSEGDILKVNRMYDCPTI